MQKQYDVLIDKIVPGGQGLGTLDDGRKAFVWNALPGERVLFDMTKKKSKYVEGVAVMINDPSPERVEPIDVDTYLSTSPWQMMSFQAEQKHKADIIIEGFAQQGVKLPAGLNVYNDGNQWQYRNKVEFSWYGSEDTEKGIEKLDLAFFRRGTKGKMPLEACALLPEAMLILAKSIRDALQQQSITARELKSLIIRCDQQQNCVWQLYMKDRDTGSVASRTLSDVTAQGGEVIYSDPKSPASIISERLHRVGKTTLTDEILNTPFRYNAESFFQVNIPVYSRALDDMRKWIDQDTPTVDLYSGVGSIGLTIGSADTTLIELNPDAVREMRRNISTLSSDARAILAASENALEYITSEATIILDPPRAGLHKDVVHRLLETNPHRIIYLSCNPITQARDVSLLLDKYTIKHVQGYNFFPRTPHIENLVVLDTINAA